MLTDVLGIVANVSTAWPTSAHLIELGTRGVRTIVYEDAFDDLDTALKALPAGTRVIVVLNRENRAQNVQRRAWEQVVADFATRFGGRVAAVECLNEWDADATRPLGTPGKWTPAAAVGMALVAAPILHQANIACLLGSVAGGDWPQQLEQAAGLLSDSGRAQLDGVCLHPYGKSAKGFPPNFIFGELDDAVRSAHERSGLPVWVTEFGIKLVDAAGNRRNSEDDATYLARARQAQAQYLSQACASLAALPPDVLAGAYYFAYADGVGATNEQGLNAFGLRDPQDIARPAWSAFQQVVAQGSSAVAAV